MVEHQHPNKSVLFDLRLPKSQRQVCDKCDDFRVALRAAFTDQQKVILRRAAQFSDFTEAEVWRLSSEKPALLDDISMAYEKNYPVFEAKSLDFFDKREAVARSMMEQGRFEESDKMPTYEDSPTLHHFVVPLATRGRSKYALVRILPGDSAAFDAALSQREMTVQQLSVDFNAAIRRHLR